MEEWQRKLKAEKEAERKKKQDSAALLQKYRGGVDDDDLKLKALREEERTKKMDAQNNLHNYKAKEVEGVNNKKQQRNHDNANLPVPVNADGSASHDPLAGIEFGSVSERAAALAKLEAEQQQQQSAAAAAEQLSETTTTPAVVSTTPADVLSSSSTLTHEPIDISMPSDIPAVHHPAHEAKQSLGSIPDVLNLNVLFSFGVVTVQDRPNLDSYMRAVQTILSDLSDETSGVSYDSTVLPFVKEQHWDETYTSRRPDIRRLVVTAAVPVQISDASFKKAAKRSIVSKLQESIASGEFLNLASAY